eukprot:scaffold8065_cov267-Pinguiococcus_pyrenoidosus.AAC.3
MHANAAKQRRISKSHPCAASRPEGTVQWNGNAFVTDRPLALSPLLSHALHPSPTSSTGMHFRTRSEDTPNARSSSWLAQISALLPRLGGSTTARPGSAA